MRFLGNRTGRLAALGVLFLLFPAIGEDSSPSSGPVLIRLKFVPGRTSVYSVRTENSVQQAGADGVFRSVATYSITRKEQSTVGDKAFIDHRIDRIQYVATGEQGETRIDTAVPPRGKESSDETLMRGVVGKVFSVSMDNRGRVADVRGPAISLAPDKKAHAGLAFDLVGEQRVRALLVSQYAWLPEVAVSIGEIWSRSEEAPAGLLTLARENSARIARALPDGRLMIDAGIKVSHRPDAGVETAEGRLSGELIAGEPGAANIVFNTSTGMMESLRAQVAFTMRIVMVPKGKLKKQTSIVQVMDARTTVELLSVNGKPLSPSRLGN